MVVGLFRELLARSGLVQPEQVAPLGLEIAPHDPQGGLQLARLLVRQGQLTRYQAERLLEGRTRGFFLDEFAILELLGAGGMAFLYLARDRQGRLRALKVVTEKFRHDKGILARLQTEFEAGRRIRHPHVVRTLDSRQGEDLFGPVPYLVLEFVRGITLDEVLLLHRRLPWRQACHTIRQAALGLHAAHGVGVIHRDVKPANLMLDAAGETRVIDFGLALVRDTGLEAEFSLAMLFGHDCLGTADFIPPEQAAEGQRVDARADIYSLACTFYNLLTGVVPFPAPTTRLKLAAHRETPFPDVRARVPELPDEVANLLTSMAGKQPTTRPASMADVAQTLQPFCEIPQAPFEFDRILAHRAALARKRYPPNPSGQQLTGSASRLGHSSPAVDHGSPPRVATPPASGEAPSPDRPS